MDHHLQGGRIIHTRPGLYIIHHTPHINAPTYEDFLHVQPGVPRIKDDINSSDTIPHARCPADEPMIFAPVSELTWSASATFQQEFGTLLPVT